MIWNGTYAGKFTCSNSYKWGVSRIVTYLDNSVSVVRTLDENMLGCISDELSGLFGLYKTGTISIHSRGYKYTCYSFMCGERPYIMGTDYELDEIAYRWKMYYSWWNVNVDDRDIYIRKYYGRDVIVVYPSCAWKSDIISDKNTFPIVLPSKDRSNRDILESWLGCYNEEDIGNLIDKIRNSLFNIIDRINPQYIHIANTILTRIKNYLIYVCSEK